MHDCSLVQGFKVARIALKHGEIVFRRGKRTRRRLRAASGAGLRRAFLESLDTAANRLNDRDGPAERADLAGEQIDHAEPRAAGPIGPGQHRAKSGEHGREMQDVTAYVPKYVIQRSERKEQITSKELREQPFE